MQRVAACRLALVQHLQQVKVFATARILTQATECTQPSLTNAKEVCSCPSTLLTLSEQWHRCKRGIASVCSLALAVLHLLACRCCPGKQLRALARRLPCLVVFRYVDEFFGPELEANIHHSKECSARQR